jgi:transcriptional regulator with XRE-family HTH domain
MASTPLSNYLRKHRKRLGLSQVELAHLLGAKGGAKVCRYEKSVRIPPLETALAYEVILGRPVRELFAGIYRTAEIKVARQAGKRLRGTWTKKHSARFRELLEHLAFVVDKNRNS